jgi:hypothetical protein
LFAIQGQAFPYWITGWNYVGQGGELALLNNDNAFTYSLLNMGFQFERGFGPGHMECSVKHMRGIDGFEQIKEFLKTSKMDVEPFRKAFPLRSRLVNRWWDRAFIEKMAEEPFPAA